jgi:hypothetical protein
MRRGIPRIEFPLTVRLNTGSWAARKELLCRPVVLRVVRWEPEIAILVGILIGLAFALVLLRILDIV